MSSGFEGRSRWHRVLQAGKSCFPGSTDHDHVEGVPAGQPHGTVTILGPGGGRSPAGVSLRRKRRGGMGIHRMTQGFYCKEEQISGAAAGRASWVKHIANLKKKRWIQRPKETALI